MHKQQAFANLEYSEKDFEITNSLCDTVLSLPMHPYLKEEEVHKVCEVIKNYIE